MKIHPATSIAAALVAVAFCDPPRSEAAAPPVQSEQALAAEARGVVRSVEDGGFVLRMEEGELAVRVSERTQYTLDGEPAERSEVLRSGARVVVTHEAGMASKVAATSDGALHALASETLRGTIRSVSDDEFTLAVDGRETVVRVDAETKYTLDGEPSDRGAVLRAGEYVTVTAEDGLAKVVAAAKSDALAPESLRGQVRTVEDDAFVVTHGEETTRVRTTRDTEYRLDGEIAPRNTVLAIGNAVVVEHADGVATRVEARSSQAATAAEVVRGTVGDVTADGFTLTTQGEPLRVRVDDRTKYLLDGEPAERSAVVKAGQVVSVEHTDGLATSVSAMTSR